MMVSGAAVGGAQAQRLQRPQMVPRSPGHAPNAEYKKNLQKGAMPLLGGKVLDDTNDEDDEDDLEDDMEEHQASPYSRQTATGAKNLMNIQASGSKSPQHHQMHIQSEGNL